MRKIFLFVSVLIAFIQLPAHAGVVSCPPNHRDFRILVARVTLEGSKLIAPKDGALVTLWSNEGVYLAETPFAMNDNKSDETGWVSLVLNKSSYDIHLERLPDSSIAATLSYPGDTMKFYGCSLRD